MATNEELLPRTEYVKHTIRLTLNEMYTGTERKLLVHNNRVCDECVGTGSISGRPKIYDVCEQCNGLGIKAVITRPEPDVEQRIVRDCYMCWGNGAAIITTNRCPICSGEGVVGKPNVIVVKVRRGSRDGQKIIYKNEGNQTPNKRPGDVYIVLESKDHPIFTRDGDDLIMKMQLTMSEALCGFEKYVETLDQRQLRIKPPPGKVVQDNDQKCIPGEGMPKFNNPREKGNLIITFEVDIPDRIRTKHIVSLEECLPPREVINIPMDVKECNMINLNHYHPSNNPLGHYFKELRNGDILLKKDVRRGQTDQLHGQNYIRTEYESDDEQPYHDYNSYEEAQRNNEHPSERDRHYNHQGNESTSHFHQEDDSMES